MGTPKPTAWRQAKRCELRFGRRRSSTLKRKIYLIGHSHGGNVIRYALDGRSEHDVKACFFLGTPFINFAPRNLLVFKKLMRALAITLWTLFALSFVGTLGLILSAHAQTAAEVEGMKEIFMTLAHLFRLGLGLMSAVVGVVMVVLLRLTPRMRRLQRKTITEMSSGSESRRRDYIFFSPLDEATAWLRVVDGLSNMIVRLTQHLQKVAVVCLKHNKWVMRFLIPTTILGILAAAGGSPSLFLWTANFMAASSLIMTMVFIMLLMPVLILIWLAVGLLLRSSIVAYGWEGFATYWLFAITADRHPRRAEAASTVHVRCKLERPGRFGLLHSAFYETADVAQFIASQIAGRSYVSPRLRIAKGRGRRAVSRLPRAMSLYAVPAYFYGFAWIPLALFVALWVFDI